MCAATSDTEDESELHLDDWLHVQIVEAGIARASDERATGEGASLCAAARPT